MGLLLDRSDRPVDTVLDPADHPAGTRAALAALVGLPLAVVR
jgi:hypothetical protein